MTAGLMFPKLGVTSLRGQGGCYCGRRGLPREWVLRMYADYQRLGSLSKAGALHGRTRQNMWGIFQTAGLKLRRRNFRPAITYQGRKYTTDGYGYWRDTIYRSQNYRPGMTYLHHRIWIAHHGPIPPGHTICFKDGNRQNCAIGNLEMLTHDEQQQRRGTGKNGATVTAGTRLELLLSGRAGMTATMAGRR